MEGGVSISVAERDMIDKLIISHIHLTLFDQKKKSLVTQLVVLKCILKSYDIEVEVYINSSKKISQYLVIQLTICEHHTKFTLIQNKTSVLKQKTIL